MCYVSVADFFTKSYFVLSITVMKVFVCFIFAALLIVMSSTTDALPLATKGKEMKDNNENVIAEVEPNMQQGRNVCTQML